MAAQKIILFCCGTFNPPTIMHLRMFELARDYFHKSNNYKVIGGIVSAVHDGYGKKGMLSSQHRIKMLELATTSTPWIKISRWEAEAEGWNRTRAVLDYHQEQLNRVANGSLQSKLNWMPDDIDKHENVKIKMLSGADVLESFNVENLWKNEDMETLAEYYGIVVITRDGNDPQKSIYKNDILCRCEGNINIVTERMANQISSTGIRTALRRGESIRYFVLDSVLDYIYAENLYSN